jgi:hypothetical protein
VNATSRASLVLAALLFGCSRSPPDATPEGAVRLFVDKMESSGEDSRAMREAYGVLGPRARGNLKDRAERASRGQGRRYEPYEMLAEGRFGLKFRPRTMTSHVSGDDATVEVVGEGPEERASVHCTREGSAWRVEPDLPEAATTPKRPGYGQ